MTDEFSPDESLESDSSAYETASEASGDSRDELNEASDDTSNPAAQEANATEDDGSETAESGSDEQHEYDEQHEAEQVHLKDLILDICLAVMALVSCIVAFATSGKMEDRSAAQPVPLAFVDDSVSAELTVRIDQRNRLIVNKQPLDEYTTLRDYLGENGLSPTTVHVVASQDCLMESVIHAIRSLKRLGVTQVFLSTSSI